METLTAISDVAGVIQLAVAPVFLLAGIAGFLNVMSGRLGRIVDRARVVERRIAGMDDVNRLPANQKELLTLWRRIHLINKTIALCVGSGLMVCSVVVSLFIGDFWKLEIGEVVVVLFVLALLLLIIALLMFLKEVQLATRSLRIGRQLPDEFLTSKPAKLTSHIKIE